MAVARSGARLVVPVLGVTVDDAGEVWHVVEKPLAADCGNGTSWGASGGLSRGVLADTL